jgi:cellulose synthase/poly-beta-1,6-N-acetylglucosamine synthase-like glycosyltransferase
MTLWVLAGATMLLLSHLVVALGLIRNRLRHRRTARQTLPRHRLSVVIVLKDEAQGLPALLESLTHQTHQDFDIVFVDDGSSDGSVGLLRRFEAQHPDRVQVIRGGRDHGDLSPKQQRLDEGIAVAKGEVILFTDGDCTVPPRWVEDTAKAFADDEVALVFGQLAVRRDGSWLQAQQAFDLPLLQHFAAGSAGLGLATGGCGNNQAVRRSALTAIGGFAGLGYTLTEDTALVSAMRRHGLQVQVTASPSTTTETDPRATLGGLYQQRLRWMGGLWWASDPITRLAVRGYAGCCVAAILGVPLGLGLATPALLLWPAALVTGVLAVAVIGATGQQRRSLRWLLAAVPLTLGFIASQALLACLMTPWGPAPVWKGRKLGLRKRLAGNRNAG